MAQNAFIKLTSSFADETNRVLELGPFDTTATNVTPQQVRANVRTFNTNIANIANLYLSDEGASCTGITAASIIVSRENEINLN